MPHLGSPIKPEATADLCLKRLLLQGFAPWPCYKSAYTTGARRSSPAPPPRLTEGAIFLIPTMKRLAVGEFDVGFSFFLDPAPEIIQRSREFFHSTL